MSEDFKEDERNNGTMERGREGGREGGKEEGKKEGTKGFDVISEGETLHKEPSTY